MSFQNGLIIYAYKEYIMKTPQEYIDNFIYERRTWNELDEEEKKNFNPYLVNKVLGCCNDLVPIVASAGNSKGILSNKELYFAWCLEQIVPGHNYFFDHKAMQAKCEYEDLKKKVSKIMEIGTKDAEMVIKSKGIENLSNLDDAELASALKVEVVQL